MADMILQLSWRYAAGFLEAMPRSETSNEAAFLRKRGSRLGYEGTISWKPSAFDESVRPDKPPAWLSRPAPALGLSVRNLAPGNQASVPFLRGSFQFQRAGDVTVACFLRKEDDGFDSQRVHHLNGLIAQSVERLNGIEKVASSILAGSTKISSGNSCRCQTTGRCRSDPKERLPYIR